MIYDSWFYKFYLYLLVESFAVMWCSPRGPWPQAERRRCLTKDVELNRVAGNTISIPVVGAILAVMLGSSVVKSDGDIDNSPAATDPDFLSGAELPDVVSVGHQRVSMPGKEWGSLLAKAGKSSQGQGNKRSQPAASSSSKVQKKMDAYIRSK